MRGSQSTTTPRAQRFTSVNETASSPSRSQAKSQSRERIRPSAAIRPAEAAMNTSNPAAVSRRARRDTCVGSAEKAVDGDVMLLADRRLGGVDAGDPEDVPGYRPQA